MKYLYIELNGFNRFALNQIDHFSMNIVNHLQIILGTNGSGKSSLLQQLTPLPANPADFSKEGSKIIRISHHESIYELKSTFSPSQKHSFIKDDVELNKGGTTPVQRELVKKHFGITKDIHSLLLGEENFASMDPPRRKEWFIQLCDTNYEYAIKIYNKLRERHRDVTGALKIAKKKLIAESEKTIKTEEETKLKDEVQMLHDQLSHLLEYRKPVEHDEGMLGIKQSDIDTIIFKHANSLSELFKLNNGSILTQEIISARISKAGENVASSQALIEKYANEHNANNEKISILQKAEQNTIETLREKIRELSDRQDIISSDLLFVDVGFDAISAMSSFLSTKTALSDIFSTIPSNEDKKYSGTVLASAREELSILTTKKKNLIDNLHANEAKQKHMVLHKDKPDMSCPRCNHSFSIHYSETAYTKIDESINAILTALEVEINPKIKELETYIEDCAQYSVLYRQYVQCVSNFSILNPYWNYLSNKNIVTNNPKAGIVELGIIERDLKNQMLYATTVKEHNELLSLMVSLKDVGGANLNTLLLVNEELQNRLEEHTDALQRALQAKTKYTVLFARNKEIKVLCDKIQEYMDKKHTLCKDEIETIRRKIFNETIRLMQSKLANKEHILTSIKTQRDTIQNINIGINELESEEEALALMVKQLSPADGLIAEGLFGFIKGFVGQMNNLIKKVWTYPLEVQSCELADDNSVDLDYKFPMSTSHGSNPIPDVSKGSKGMIEVINLAFKIVAMRYLKLQGSPLILDEASASMDHEHKKTFAALIHKLLEQQSFPQVFIISHDYIHYNSISNASYHVLNTLNIILPREYNEHVTMK